jgi:hypothetical protein
MPAAFSMVVESKEAAPTQRHAEAATEFVPSGAWHVKPNHLSGYTLEEDERGWQWIVVLGSPSKIESGHAPTKGIAILKVWAAIERVLGSRQFRRLRSVRPET